MPSLVVTKESLDTLFIQHDSCEYCNDLFDFIRSDYFGYDLVCDLSSDEEYKKAIKDNPIWELLMDNYLNISYNININADLARGDLGISDEHCIFLTDLDEAKCDELTQNFGFLFISIHNVKKYWEVIKTIRKQVQYKVTSDVKIPNELRFDCWDKIDWLNAPLTSIIIFDKYIMSDKTNQKLQNNLFELLNRLCTNKKLERKITLTIISDFKRDDLVKAAYLKLEQYLASKALKNVHINIIRHDKMFYPSSGFEGLHSRIVMTNYFKLKSDDSFNFFKSNGKVNNDADLHISFNLSKRSRAFFEKELNHLKTYISRVENRSAEIPLPEKLFYFKDKLNHLWN